MSRCVGVLMTLSQSLDDQADPRIFGHNISTQCVSIASSIDTTPPEMIPHEMRERWLRELRKTAVALDLLIERLAGGATAEA